MHVQMNVQDKTAWFAHIARCLAPGARLAIWEVCQPPQADLPWPMPWSLDGHRQLRRHCRLTAHLDRAGRLRRHRVDGRNGLGPSLDRQDLRERPARRTGSADAPRRRLHPGPQRHRRTRQRLPRDLARGLHQERPANSPAEGLRPGSLSPASVAGSSRLTLPHVRPAPPPGRLNTVDVTQRIINRVVGRHRAFSDPLQASLLQRTPGGHIRGHHGGKHRGRINTSSRCPQRPQRSCGIRDRDRAALGPR